VADIQFLTENEYKHPLSTKLLTAPSNKDFTTIFLFLYNKIDPNYVLTEKPEDEIPVLFRQLKLEISLVWSLT
jgi:kinetochore protein NDC80